MQLQQLDMNGPLLLQPTVHGDERGFFVETYREEILRGAGIDERWVQDNQSRSGRGVVRGMHFQVGDGQAKLVRCARGEIADYIVDIRRGSPTYGRWDRADLTEENQHQLYIPVGFAHGFCVTSEVADVVYKCSSYYAPDYERGFAYDDPDVGIEWPELELIVSERDAGAPRLAQIEDQLPFQYTV